MGTAEKPDVFDCYDAKLPDEPHFTLLARDPHAPGKVRGWAYERERSIRRGDHPIEDLPKVQQAREIADQMDLWRMTHHPDRWRKAAAATE